MIHCLILEDEIAAQEVLMNYIDKTPFIECLGIYESGLDIPIEKLAKADLMFLDIQLPELNGLSFLKTLQNPPKVIITSAFSNYAIEAFEQAVLDYLVKPFSYERFLKAVSRIRTEDALIKPEQPKSKQLFIYADKTIYKINIDDILFLKAEVDYVRLVSKEKRILIYDSLKNWKHKLEKYDFFQIHRSYIINMNGIEKVYANQVFISGESLPIGKTHKNEFINKLMDYSD